MTAPRRLHVVSPGLLTTVQDLGRPGLASAGVPPAGALDAEALRVANRLVGNVEGAAGLELWAVGPTLRAEERVDLVVLGGRFGPAPGEVLTLGDGESVALASRDGAARAVVAVAGGVDVPLVLGSRSTSLAARFGGLSGRRLERGDALGLGAAGAGGPTARTAAAKDVEALELLGGAGDVVTLRVVPGPQADAFDVSAREAFFASPYRLLPESNRAGFRLAGAAVARRDVNELASEPALVGSIQIPHDGQPIVLLHEGPTTGGYPKLAKVIDADLGRLVRVRPSQAIRFLAVSFDEARAALVAREAATGRIAP